MAMRPESRDRSAWQLTQSHGATPSRGIAVIAGSFIGLTWFTVLELAVMMQVRAVDASVSEVRGLDRRPPLSPSRVGG